MFEDIPDDVIRVIVSYALYDFLDELILRSINKSFFTCSPRRIPFRPRSISMKNAFTSREMLQWCINEQNLNPQAVMLQAARINRRDILEYLHGEHYRFTCEVSHRASLYGHLDLLKWLVSIGAPQDNMVPFYAAEGGHLEMLEWISHRGYHLMPQDVMRARIFGHEHVAQWMVKHGWRS
jgi:hypothetical protein